MVIERHDAINLSKSTMVFFSLLVTVFAYFAVDLGYPLAPLTNFNYASFPLRVVATTSLHTWELKQFSPSTSIIMSGSSTPSPFIWISRDGSKFMHSESNTKLKFYQLTTTFTFFRELDYPAGINSFWVSQECNSLITAGNDAVTRAWQFSSGSFIELGTIGSCPIPVKQVAASDNMLRIARRCPSLSRISLSFQTSPGSFPVLGSINVSDEILLKYSFSGDKLLIVEATSVALYQIYSSGSNSVLFAKSGTSFNSADFSDEYIVISDGSRTIVYLAADGSEFQSLQGYGFDARILEDFYIVAKNANQLRVYRQCYLYQVFYIELCVTTCPPSMQPDFSTGTCMPCTYDTTLQICVITCPAGQYQNSSLICNPCQNKCKTCSSYSACLSCSMGLFLQQSSCEQRCLLPGNFKNHLTKKCEPCGSVVDLQFQECVLTCRFGTFPSSGFCLNCMKGCQTCTSQYDCVTCRFNFYYLNGKCLQSCPEGYYSSKQAQFCQKCRSLCKSCIDDNSCLSCQGSSLYSKGCVSECPKDYFQLKNVCLLYQTESIRVQISTEGLDQAFGQRRLVLKFSHDLATEDINKFFHLKSILNFNNYSTARSLTFTSECQTLTLRDQLLLQSKISNSSESWQGRPFHKSSYNLSLRLNFSCLKSPSASYAKFFNLLSSINSKIYQYKYQTRFLSTYLLPLQHTVLYNSLQYSQLTLTPELSESANLISLGVLQSKRCWANDCPYRNNLAIKRVLNQRPAVFRMANFLLAFAFLLLIALSIYTLNKFNIGILWVSILWDISDNFHELTFLLALGDLTAALSSTDLYFFLNLGIFGYCFGYLLLRFYNQQKIFQEGSSSAKFQQVFPHFSSMLVRYNFNYSTSQHHFLKSFRRVQLSSLLLLFQKAFVVLSATLFAPYSEWVLSLLALSLLFMWYICFVLRPFRWAPLKWTVFGINLCVTIGLSCMNVSTMLMERETSLQSYLTIVGLTGTVMIWSGVVLQFIYKGVLIDILLTTDHKKQVLENVRYWFLQKLSSSSLKDSEFVDRLIEEGDLNNANMKTLQDCKFLIGQIRINENSIHVKGVSQITANPKAFFMNVGSNFKVSKEFSYALEGKQFLIKRRQLNQLLPNICSVSIFKYIVQKDLIFGKATAIDDRTADFCILTAPGISRRLNCLPSAVKAILLKK